MDGGIEQNPAYGTARTSNLQDKRGIILSDIGDLTPCYTPTALRACSEAIFLSALPFRLFRLYNAGMGTMRSADQRQTKKGVLVMNEREPLYAPDQEAEIVKELDEILAKQEGIPGLLAPTGEVHPLPHSVYEVLRDAVHELAQGGSVTIMPMHSYVTTQRAADILGVSRPHLVKLLEREDIPYHKVGKHRRIRLLDLLVYKDQRDSKRKQILDQIKADSEELGLYDLEDE
jgi:excisionase family DNA binding protein